MLAGQSRTTHSSQGQSTSCRTVPLDDLEDRILAQSEPVADFAIRLTFADQLENLGCKSIGFDALARPTTEHDAAQARSRDAGTHTLTQQIAFELRERRHQAGDEFALGAAQVELQACLGDQGDVPRLQVLQCVEQVEHRAAPAGEIRDEDDVDLARLSEHQNLLALGAVVLGARAGFLPDADDL